MGFIDSVTGKLFRGNNNGILLAYGKEYGSTEWWSKPLRMDPERLMNLNGTVIGGSGCGKSRFMYNIVGQQIYEIAQGKKQTVIVIDPAGDAFRYILRLIAHYVAEGYEELADRLLIIDPTYRRDKYGSVGINVLEVEEDEEPFDVRAELQMCFKYEFERTGGYGDRMSDILINLFALIQNNGLTLAEAIWVLTNEDLLRTLLEKVTDESVLLFWKEHFLKVSKYERRIWIESSRNKLNAFCNSNPYLLPIFSQRNSTISFRRVTNDGVICLVNASKNHLKGSRGLFCSLILSKIYMALLARETMEESLRTPVFMHVDELPEVYNPSSVLGILTGCRKFGCSLTGYFQNPSQFQASEMDNILGNCAIQTTFWTDRKGAERMSKELFNFTGRRVKDESNGYIRYWTVQEEMEHATSELSSQRPRECYIRLRGVSEQPYVAETPEVKDLPPLPEIEEKLREISAKKYNRSLKEIYRELEERKRSLQAAMAGHGEDKPDSKPGQELSSDEQLLLQDVHSRPFVVLSRRYHDLSARLSKSKAGRTKGKLVKLGYVEEVLIKLGKRGGQPKLLKLTDKGCAYLSVEDPYKKMGKGGFQHIFWQNCIAQNFQDHGYKAAIEDNVGRNAADVALEIDDQRIAVEVTLHNENVTRNVHRDLKSGYQEVWVACPDNVTLDRTRKKLEKELGDDSLGERVRFHLLADLAGDVGI